MIEGRSILNIYLEPNFHAHGCPIGHEGFFGLVRSKVVVIEQSEADSLKCKPFFPVGSAADVVHAATCLHTGAVLISNDAHFDGIKEVDIIEVWSITDAIKELF